MSVEDASWILRLKLKNQLWQITSEDGHKLKEEQVSLSFGVRAARPYLTWLESLPQVHLAWPFSETLTLT